MRVTGNDPTRGFRSIKSVSVDNAFHSRLPEEGATLQLSAHGIFGVGHNPCLPAVIARPKPLIPNGLAMFLLSGLIYIRGTRTTGFEPVNFA